MYAYVCMHMNACMYVCIYMHVCLYVGMSTLITFKHKTIMNLCMYVCIYVYILTMYVQ